MARFGQGVLDVRRHRRTLVACYEPVFDERLQVPDEAIELGCEYALGMRDVQSRVSQEEAARS